MKKVQQVIISSVSFIRVQDNNVTFFVRDAHEFLFPRVDSLYVYLLLQLRSLVSILCFFQTSSSVSWAIFLTSVLVCVFRSSRDSTGVECIFDFMCPRKKKSNDVKSGDRGRYEIGHLCQFNCLVACCLITTSLEWKSEEERHLVCKYNLHTSN